MTTAIYYSGKYGSTRQYASWLHEDTGFPAYDTAKDAPEPSGFDRIILGSSIIVGAPTIKKWLGTNWEAIREKPVLLFTVSGTPPGHPDLKAWLEKHLTPHMLSHMEHIALRGRLDLSALPLWLRLMLRLGARATDDPEARDRMRNGFDFMDRNTLKPIAEWARETVATAPAPGN